MGPKKGTGVPKGKQPAPRTASRPPKRPAVALSSDEEDEGSTHQSIMARIAALEQARAPQAGIPGKSGKGPVRTATRSVSFADIMSRLSALEGTSGDGGAAPSASAGSQTAEEGMVEAAATEIQASWPEEAGQLALVVQPPEAEGAVGRQERVRILICGHSMAFWAAHQARRSWIGSQLGLSRWATIEWQGRRGLRWAGLLPLLFEGRSAPPPHILVVHLGGNDLGLMKGVALSWQARDDFLEIRRRWPGVLIFWSAMLPRRVWREALDHRAIERARRMTNRALFKIMTGGLGIYLPHPQIRAESVALYRGDGVHLSYRGNSIFLDDIRQGLRLALSHVWGAEA
ncbi:uncharacterized protein LOC129337113 [Eublepharis macularius]|uniref:Uncharacterized protein LOC129337113 n=1 Tax=Eublepharis macularius TaxID=481883 RepID=A0AA97JW44_EUBMA|nr:uncharacterized protein LOC129337113 [Eublepharis macularius]